MEKGIGMEKPEIQELPRIQDRMTFIYLEHCRISRDNGAITVKTKTGITNIPAAAISVLLLCPGTDVTHRAMELIGDAGVTVLWVGEHGVRYYAHGRALTNHSTLLLKQAQLVSNEKKHIQVARMMYQMRFPEEDVSTLTMQQLRGREGSRIRSLYREQSKKWNVEWNGRVYRPEDYQSGDPVNKALSSGNACLYGLAHAVICALGCSPGLGFVHVGHELAFAYDIADLYKAETTIPIAFEMAAEVRDKFENKIPQDFSGMIRRRLRDEIVKIHLLERMVHDIKYLLSDGGNGEGGEKAVYLWDNIINRVDNGIQYRESGVEQDDSNNHE